MRKARPAPTDTPAWRPHAHFHLAAVAGLVVLTAALYAGSLDGALIQDDMVIVRHAPHIRSLRNVGLFFRPAYWREHRPGKSYRPVVETSKALNWALTGGAPVGLRAVNVALLAVAAALVYALAWRLSGSFSAALIAGLVFAGHPAHLETITIVKNRSEILAAVFGLLALLWFLRDATGVLPAGVRSVSRTGGQAASGTGRGRWWVWWLACIAAMALALGSKEVALALPLVMTAAAILLVPSPSPSQGEGRGEGANHSAAVSAAPGPQPRAAAPHGRQDAGATESVPRPVLPGRAVPGAGAGAWGGRSGRGRRRALALTAPMWLMAIGFVVILFSALPGRYPQWETSDFPGLLEFARLGPASRGLVVVKTTGTYLGLLAWPFTVCHHRGFEIPRGLWRADVLASLAACLVVAVLVLWTWRRSRPTAFAFVWLAAAVAPVANLVPVATRPIAEQRLFGATIPFAILVGLLAGKRCQELFSRNGRKRVPGAFSVTVLAAWLVAAGVTVTAALPTWRTRLALWERTARQSPGVWRAQYNHGAELLKHGRLQDAVVPLERAIRLNDLQPDAVYNLAYGLLGMKRHAEATRLLRLVLTWRPDLGSSHATLAVALLDGGRAVAAVHEAEVAVRLEPDEALRHATLGRILLRVGRVADAIPPLRRARDLAPDDLQHRMVLVDALEAAGRLDEALAECLAIVGGWPGRPARAAEVRARHIQGKIRALRRPPEAPAPVPGRRR